MKENNEFKINGTVHMQELQSNDPFEIYKLLNKKEAKETTKGDDPTYPPGFTPNEVVDEEEEDMANSINQPDANVHSLNDGVSSVKNRVNRPFKIKSGGSILELMENLVDVRQTIGYNMEGCLGQSTKKSWIRELNRKNKINFAAIQETKLENIDLFSIKALWGNFSYYFASSPLVEFSWGILFVWDPNMFVKHNVTILDYFVAVHGTRVATSTKIIIVSVYAPQDLSKKKILWDYITHMIDSWDGECIILGDFNEVRSTNFNDSGAKAFNNFISMAGLIDLHLEGYSYTWAIKSASKMRKLDRFLVSEGILSVYPSLSTLCLDRQLSDHRPIIMREAIVNYGPYPFQVYHSWFAKDGFDKLVDDSWKNSNFMKSSKITLLRKKFQALKASITACVKRMNNVLMSDWIDEPYKVKNEFLNHFSNRFSMPSGPSINLDTNMFKHISSDQNLDLESEVIYDEIKKAVWDYGTNKSPGPDGFTFDFIRRYWKIINQDVVNAVWEFFVTCKFPPSSNSLFITLISKKQDAKVVKDFCPISLIGSFYTIIAKILANRLSMVISDLISDVQSAFVSNRQILNGLFKGIHIDESLTLSHLFYADDAIFIGKWDRANVITIVHMLKCFFLASGLKINIHKSKLMGIGVSHEDVNAVANIIGSLYDDHVSLDSPGSVSCPSLWNRIIRELGTLSLAPHGGMEEEQYLQLIDLVASVTLSNSNDRWVWLLDSSGEYSVNLARSYIDDSLLPTVGSPTRWVKVVPIKINIFAWKVCLDNLPMRLNLSLCGIDIPFIICPICSLAGESCSHLLFSCIMAHLLFRKVARWWDLYIPEFISYEDWLAWFNSIRLAKGFKDVLEGVFFVMWWVIWKFPNQEAKSKLLEATKLHVYIGLNTYLGKLNTRVPISSYELSTLNLASNVVLEGN
ncbi:RNA-directed DNA polymerase, eukaryota [Tanacetum coccineum]